MNKITVGADGPLHFTGNLEVLDGAGAVVDEARDAWLCRCGASARKPYCDGSHRAAGFEDAGLPGVTDLGSSQTGVVKLSPRTDGPLKCQGPLEICDVQGRPVWRGTETALCRCGASARKPFCDGKHRQIGFKSA